MFVRLAKDSRGNKALRIVRVGGTANGLFDRYHLLSLDAQQYLKHPTSEFFETPLHYQKLLKGITNELEESADGF
jgi:hypothetical protein